MATQLTLPCLNCGRMNAMPVAMEDGSSIQNITFGFNCSFCGAPQEQLIHHVKQVMGQIISVIADDPNPAARLKEAIKALDALKGTRDFKRAKRSGGMAKLKGLIPEKPEDILVYMKALRIFLVVLAMIGIGAKVKDLSVEDILKLYSQSQGQAEVRQHQATEKPSPPPSPRQKPTPRKLKRTKRTDR